MVVELSLFPLSEALWSRLSAARVGVSSKVTVKVPSALPFQCRMALV
jgi:hypothetical protein